MMCRMARRHDGGPLRRAVAVSVRAAAPDHRATAAPAFGSGENSTGTQL